ncbi:hypothetical protein HN51_058348 [Arachis hypogaea]
MWKLNPNETMVKNYSGLCVIVESAKDGISPGGICSWIAKGRRGRRHRCLGACILLTGKISGLVGNW